MKICLNVAIGFYINLYYISFIPLIFNTYGITYIFSTDVYVHVHLLLLKLTTLYIYSTTS